MSNNHTRYRIIGAIAALCLLAAVRDYLPLILLGGGALVVPLALLGLLGAGIV